jgi:hypothetical protein
MEIVVAPLLWISNLGAARHCGRHIEQVGKLVLAIAATAGSDRFRVAPQQTSCGGSKPSRKFYS